MMLPPFRKTVKIKFSSLRNGLGAGLGVIFDIDTMVERDAYRVRVPDGNWKWQIRGLNKMISWDSFAETDQEILDEYGPGIDVCICT